MMIRYIFLICFAAELHAQTTTSITVLFTNNSNGVAEICDCGPDPLGGLARRKSFFDSVGSKAVRLDAGDFLDAFGFGPRKDELVLELYRKLNYDAVSPGDQEFANGPAFLPKLIQSGLPFTSISLPSLDGQNIPQDRVFTREGITIGVIGYLPWASFTYFPKDVKLPFSPWGDQRSALKKKIAELRPRVDLIILLSHAGWEEDQTLAKQIGDVDLIIGAHSQTEPEAASVVGKTVIVQASGGGTHVGKIEMNGRKGAWKTLSFQLVPMASSIPQDHEFQSKIEAFERENQKRRQ